MGYFSGLKEAKVWEKGVPLKVGIFELEITKTFILKTRSKGDAFIAEFKVLESNNPEQPVGSNASWYQSMQDMSIAQGAIKEFLANARGYNLRDAAHKAAFAKDQEPYMDAIGNEAIDEIKAPYKCRRIRVETVMTKTKKENKDFTQHRWSPAAGQNAMPLPVDR